MDALLIPHDIEQDVRIITIASGLNALQEQVDGWIEALPVPANGQGDREPRMTCYINEEGKYSQPVNLRATDFMRPLLHEGDFIAGNLIVLGFSPDTGENEDVPAAWAQEWITVFAALQERFAKIAAKIAAVTEAQ